MTLRNPLAILLGVVIFLVVLIAFPYLTYASFTTLVHATGFGIAEWASALWLMLTFGGASVAASR